MVIVKLMGGLGNQMFQYAAARAVAGSANVLFDLSFLESNTITTAGFTPRRFALDIFEQLQAKQAGKAVIKSVTNHVLHRFVLPGLKFIDDDTMQGFTHKAAAKDQHVYLDGYFQNEDHFIAAQEELIKEFSFPQITDPIVAALVQQIKAANAVSIHVRRGDYVKTAVNAYHGLLPLAYYQQAIEIIKSRVSLPHFFIFSDDAEWCRSASAFLRDDATIVSGITGSSWQDMYLMTLCRHHIIANSSFSWWGAWLGRSADKVVIAPQSWFVNTALNDASNIVPQNWIKI